MAEGATESGEPRKRRPWYRLHLATWIAVILVAGALIASNVRAESCVSRPPWGTGNACTLRHTWYFGWPAYFVEGRRSETTYSPGLGLPPEIKSESESHACRLAVNVLVGFAILSSTGFLLESRARSGRRPCQVTLQSLLILTAVVAFFLGSFYSKDMLQSALRVGPFVDRVQPLVQLQDRLEVALGMSPGGFYLKFPLWICIPLLFGIGCTFYFGVWLTFGLVGIAVRRIAILGRRGLTKGDAQRSRTYN